MFRILSEMFRTGTGFDTGVAQHPGDWRPPTHWRHHSLPQGYPDHHADRPHRGLRHGTGAGGQRHD